MDIWSYRWSKSRRSRNIDGAGVENMSLFVKQELVAIGGAGA